MKLSLYSRASVSRIVALVGALFLTAVSTGAVACLSRAAATRNEDYPAVQAPRSMGSVITRTNVAPIGNFGLAKNVRAMPLLFRAIEHSQKLTDGPIGNEILNSFDPYQRDPATAELIERIRKVE
jgi:hypothetical protein